MSKKFDIDKLLQVYCEGIHAMDPKTALPFWDYDFAPLFSDLWMKKMITASKKARAMGLTPKQISIHFKNIAVPRKEVIYSLFDMKVTRIPKEDRLFYINFWWDVVTEMAKDDYLVEKSNIVHTSKEIDKFIKDLAWQSADQPSARQIGNLAMNLNSLSYGLYTDIFAHNAMENFGAYDVSKYFGGEKHILVIKQWANLRPIELYSEFKDFPFDKLNVFAIYKNIDYTVDIYTHQVYSGNAAQNLVQYAVVHGDTTILNDLADLKKLNGDLGQIVVDHFARIQSRGFEEAKRAWVLARNYQFKDFFAAVGMDWRDQEMLDQVKGKPLVKTNYWEFEKYSKATLFSFWKEVFDPRVDSYYNEWNKILSKYTKEESI